MKDIGSKETGKLNDKMQNVIICLQIDKRGHVALTKQ